MDIYIYIYICICLCVCIYLYFHIYCAQVGLISPAIAGDFCASLTMSHGILHVLWKSP